MSKKTNKTIVSVNVPVEIEQDGTAVAHNEIVATYLAEIGKIAGTGSNSKPVEIGTFQVAGIVVTLNERSVIINSDKEGDAYPVHGIMRYKGIMNALSAKQTGGYKIAEVGFHSHWSPEELKAQSYIENAAAITGLYAGKEYAHLKPQGGRNAVSQLSWIAGNFEVANTYGPELPAWNKDDKKVVSAYRYNFKHTGLDLILAGVKVNASVWTMKRGDDGKRHYDANGAMNLNTAYGASLMAETVEEAVAIRDANIAKAAIRDMDKKTFKAGMAMTESNPQLVSAVQKQTINVLVNGEQEAWAVEDLYGKTVEILTSTGTMRTRQKVSAGTMPMLFGEIGMGRVINVI